MPQNEHIELFQKRYGKRFDHEEKTRKREARSVHKKAEYAQKVCFLARNPFLSLILQPEERKEPPLS